ncbi:MAG TPA: tetratricopeptide repeat protein, partial [Casimicrobiaceae bacterium]|nr:tetratricopeptide repeat protein [Casimicrobiaceae bacterium]
MNKTGRNAQLEYDRGNAFQAQGKLDEAIDCYRRALAHKSDSADAHTNLGTALHRQGKLNEASRDFYVTSECREPAVHVQEHRYTLAQLSEVLG